MSNGVPRGVGGKGVTADDDRGCYDPVLPRFTPRGTPFDPVLVSMLNKLMINSMLPSLFFYVTSL